jgi:hypothetical protein
VKVAKRWMGFAAGVWATVGGISSVGPVLADRRSAVPRRNAILPDAKAGKGGHTSTNDGRIGQ